MKRSEFLRRAAGGIMAVLVGPRVLEAWEPVLPPTPLTEVVHPVTTTAELNEIWRRAYGGIQPGLQCMVEEYSWLEELPEIDVEFATREIVVPLTLEA